MASVLVTGGTGMLGSRLVPVLVARGHEVRVLSRQVAPDGVAAGASAVVGDVRTGEGLDDAVTGADTVIHAATSVQRRARATEVDGTRHMLAAAEQAGVGHFVYVSIVGVDRHRFPYYKAKWAAERVVAGKPDGWTIQRATQFHDLIEFFFRFRVFPATRNMAFQPVDVGDVCNRLAELVDAGPSGRAPDLGGPEVLTVRELRDTCRRLTGRQTLLLRAPRVGFLRDFDDGLHLSPDHADGLVSWSDWLARPE